MSAETEKYRPPIEDRWIGGREEPGEIRVRTRFLYSEPDGRAVLPEGRTAWAFGRGGDVVASDWPTRFEHMDDLWGHVQRAIASFGDDADLVITVALAGDRATNPSESNGSAASASVAPLGRDAVVEPVGALLSPAGKFLDEKRGGDESEASADVVLNVVDGHQAGDDEAGNHVNVVRSRH